MMRERLMSLIIVLQLFYTVVIFMSASELSAFAQEDLLSHGSEEISSFLPEEGDKISNSTTTQLKSLIQETQVELNQTGAKLGVSLSIPKRALEIHFNSALQHNSASSAKWLWAAAALQFNSPQALERYADPVFRNSDNADAGKLIDFAGGIDKVNDYTRKLGISAQEWQLCTWGYGAPRTGKPCPVKRNLFTSSGGLKFLKKLHQGSLGLSSEKTAALIEWAKRAPKSGTGGWLLERLSPFSKAKASHKAGWIPAPIGFNTLNELGIVPLENGDTLLIAVTIEGGNSFSKEELKLKELSQKIAGILTHD